VPRNALQGPGYASVDLKWTREFALTSKHGDAVPAWSVGVSAFNLFNRVNYVTYVGTLTSPFVGQPIAAFPPRRIQLSAEFHF
jgi:outer membrane receptor protein involved in Fe transport